MRAKSFFDHWQVANKLGITRSAAKYLVESGKLKHYTRTPDGRYIISEDELKKYKAVYK